MLHHWVSFRTPEVLNHNFIKITHTAFHPSVLPSRHHTTILSGLNCSSGNVETVPELVLLFHWGTGAIEEHAFHILNHILTVLARQLEFCLRLNFPKNLRSIPVPPKAEVKDIISIRSIYPCSVRSMMSPPCLALMRIELVCFPPLILFVYVFLVSYLIIIVFSFQV